MPKKAKTVKAKAPKRAKTQEPEMPGLFEIMNKIAERLDSLEKKMDVLMSLPPAGSKQPHHGQRTETLTQQAPPRHQRPHQGPKPHQPSHHHAPQHSQAQKGRQLFQAVCADCKKECEVPFKPTAERPVYCKECFTARKANRKDNNGLKAHPAPSLAGQQTVVKKHGVGKITITDMVPAEKKRRKPHAASRR
jgi:CxxC-x17-CxxC domain-containing protein